MDTVSTRVELIFFIMAWRYSDLQNQKHIVSESRAKSQLSIALQIRREPSIMYVRNFFAIFDTHLHFCPPPPMSELCYTYPLQGRHRRGARAQAR